MIYIVCALPCEAKPLISHFTLEFCSHGSPFKIYRNDNIALVISGVGKIRAASAVSYLHMFIPPRSSSIWLNIGVGGMLGVDQGAGFLAHKITDRAAQKSSYPAIVCETPCKTAEVVTVDRPESNHAEEIVYDMEASGFFHTALLFSSAELVHCYKVISDWDEASIKGVTRRLVEKLIEGKIPEISSLIESLHALLKDESGLQEVYQQIVDQWHFSTTEGFQLKRALERWEACSDGAPLPLEKFSGSQFAKDVIKKIDAMIHATPLKF